MDPKFTGEEVGCAGHKLNAYGGQGADWGLQQTIEWAKTYGKKLMMTEIASFPADASATNQCKVSIENFVRDMYESGVFIGYQVWQFGCAQCTNVCAQLNLYRSPHTEHRY